MTIAKRKGYKNIVNLLEKTLFGFKKRVTTHWMDICNSLEKTSINELRKIVRDGVKTSNFLRTKQYFEYTGDSLLGFYTYIGTLSKRRLCVYLAKYYEIIQRWLDICNLHGEETSELKSLAKSLNIGTNEYIDNLTKEELCKQLAQNFYGESNIYENCTNESTISGDDVYLLPPERLISLEQEGIKYCFYIFEVENFARLNPYNNQPLPNEFIDKVRKLIKKFPKDGKRFVNLEHEGGKFRFDIFEVDRQPLPNNLSSRREIVLKTYLKIFIHYNKEVYR